MTTAFGEVRTASSDGGSIPNGGRPPVCDLDGNRLAATLIQMVAVSALLGHERPGYTALDYCGGVTTPEARFVRDILIRSTDEICLRWMGDSFQAASLAANALAGLFAHDRDESDVGPTGREPQP